VATPPSAHSVLIGAHPPEHTPRTHADASHGDAEPQAPASVHVSTPLPCGEHCVAPGAHEPVHAPMTHAWLPQSIGAPQVLSLAQT